MKKTILIVASLMLIGAGCANAPTRAPSRGEEQKSATATEREQGQQGEATKSATATRREKGQQGDAMKSATATAAQAEAKDVIITAGGTYSPATITVKKGAKVTWKNMGSAVVWVASDPHPAHTGYPGFDSKSTIGQGETYSFTFEKVGSWSYHNHFNPSVKGTVVVTE